jgi:hypothetical protein
MEVTDKKEKYEHIIDTNLLYIYLPAVVNEEGVIAETKIELLLGRRRERRRIGGAGDYGPVLGWKKPLPNGVGFGGRSEVGGNG